MTRVALLVAAAVAGCSGSPSGSDGATGDLSVGAPRDLALADAGGRLLDLARAGDAAVDPLIAARPYVAHVPPGYDPGQPTPLVVMLHGYASDGAGHEAYYQLVPVADAHGFLYAHPDGTKDNVGLRFWNATDACCNLFGAAVDDVAYLTALVDDMAARYNVDPKRVFFVGHSNGGFMSHRMACDRAGRVAAIVAQSGDNWKDASKCKPSEPVAVLQIHSDADATINYNGGQNFPLAPYPSAHASIASWAALDQCDAVADTTAPPVDFTSDVAGSETTIERHLHCQGGAAELWTVHGGSHQPALQQPASPELIWAFLAAHPKP